MAFKSAANIFSNPSRSRSVSFGIWFSLFHPIVCPDELRVQWWHTVPDPLPVAGDLHAVLIQTDMLVIRFIFPADLPDIVAPAQVAPWTVEHVVVF
jgi:hypothetical protein